MPWKYVQYQNGQMRTTSDSGSSTLAGLTDTNISSPSANQFLTYNSSSLKWVNTTKSIPSKLNDLSDVNTSGVANNKVLGYNSSSSKWVPMIIDPGGNVDDVKVNGTTVVDDNKIAQITSYKELTRAEYDLLPDTKYSDGIMYCISDGFSNPNGFPPLIYSTEEREVGVWIDGKPLYEKTINFGALPNATTKQTNHNISNVDKIFIAGGYVTTGSSQYTLDHSSNAFANQWTISVDATNISFETFTDRSSLSAIVILQYTKTTDTAGSGKWATDGGLAKHYSTQEQIIGTWIDGKPLYERTVNIGHANIDYDVQSWNIKRCFQCYGSIEGFGNIPFIMTSIDYSIICSYGNGYIQMRIGNSLSVSNDCYITLQYTKTTD